MFLDDEEEDSRCSHFNPPSLFISKGHERLWFERTQNIILLTLILVTCA